MKSDEPTDPTAAPDVITLPTEVRQEDEFRIPPLGAMMAYRGVHALADVNQQGWLRATHYATCLVGGREPLWGVWTVHGVFQRFFGAKASIVDAYPKKAWRLRSATWHMVDLHHKDAAAKRSDMRQIFHKGQVAEAGIPVAVLFEDGTILPWEKRQTHSGDYRPLFAGPAMKNTVVPLKAVAKV